FVDLGEPDPARAAARGEELRAAIGGAVGDAVAREFGCTSHLELEFEKVYARFFMPEVRGGAMGSKKRYAGLVVTASGEEIEFVGLEAVRRDWSGVARRFQRVLLDLVFHDRPVADFIRGFVADLRAGRFDGELAYRQAARGLEPRVRGQVDDRGRRLEGRAGEEEAADRWHRERVAPHRRPRPAHRLRRADVLVGAPLEALVELCIEAPEVLDGGVELLA